MISFKVATCEGRKWKSVRYKGSENLTMKECRRMCRDTDDFSFGDRDQEFCLSMLKEAENSKDVVLLNRIIRNGGFINYIKKLESYENH